MATYIVPNSSVIVTSSLPNKHSEKSVRSITKDKEEDLDALPSDECPSNIFLAVIECVKLSVEKTVCSLEGMSSGVSESADYHDEKAVEITYENEDTTDLHEDATLIHSAKSSLK